MQTENTYVETDLGNIALNPRGEYSDETSYEYLDTVSYKGGSYVCLAELTKTISGIAPAQGKNTEHWQMLTLPGGLTSDYIAMHDDVVNKAKQVETSRAAVELSQQEIEAAQADVNQMRQDTQDASQVAIASRDSAAGYAQSAETSRTAAKESEDNINAQVTEFDTHVAEKTSAAETAITEARRAAVNAVSTKQDDATQAVTDEGDKQIKNVEDAGTEQIGKAKSAGASAVSAAGAAGVSAVNAVKAQQTASIKAVADEGTQQVTAVNTAGSTQVSTIETKGADQVKAIQEASENALQNISNGVDKGLSEEGKAADAKATGEAISNLTEDLGDSIYKYQEYDGYVGYDSGTIAELDNVKCTDFLPIKKGMTVKVKGISFEPSDYRGLAIYNKNKIYKSGYQYNQNNEYTFDVSEDGYLRATIIGKQIKIIANQNSIVKALNEVAEDAQKEIKREVNTLISEEYGEEKQLEITETKKGYAVKSDGSKENAGWISCLKFNCEAYQKIYTKNAHAHKNYPWIVLYDRNNNVIGSVNINEDSSAEIIAPNNVSYGWMNCYELVSYAQTQYLVKTIKNEYLPEKLKKLIIESNPLVNLLENGGYINIFNKIACIGDSLTEGVFEYTENGEVKYAGKPQGFEPYSYPSQLARMTGATVGNYGVGGATAKSWLETTECVNCFKEENKAQAYIIALGTNDTDYNGNVETDIDLSNYNNNVDNFVGNYAKIIQKCLELQPKAKVFVVTIPKTRTDYHNAWTIGNSQIKAIAKKLGVYVLDVYTYSESYDNPDAYKNHFYLGGHRNAIGYRRTAMEYATYISWIIYNNPDDFRNVQYIGTDYNYTN